MSEAKYGYTKNLGELDFDSAVDKVTAALKTEGFGVLTEIDVQATLKKKLDVDFRKYKILGACNPPLAYRALTEEPLVGLLLPCNVVVSEAENHTIEAAIVNPIEMFKVVDNPKLEEIASGVNDKLKRVLEAL